MPCLIGCLALLLPRLTLVLVVLFSDFIGRAYETTLWPLVGFFVMPTTTLAYAAAMNWHGSASGGYLVLVVVAVLLDLGFFGRARRDAGSHVRRRADARVIDAKLEP